MLYTHSKHNHNLPAPFSINTKYTILHQYTYAYIIHTYIYIYICIHIHTLYLPLVYSSDVPSISNNILWISHLFNKYHIRSQGHIPVLLLVLFASCSATSVFALLALLAQLSQGWAKAPFTLPFCVAWLNGGEETYGIWDMSIYLHIYIYWYIYIYI